MIYNILAPYFNDYAFFNIFRYISFRCAGALFTSLILCLIFGAPLIEFLKSKQRNGQPIRSDGPKSHIHKKGTPTMGGLMIIFSILCSAIIWCDLSNQYIWIIIFVLVSFAMLGITDDYLKVKKGNSKGLSGRKKLVLQSIFALTAIIWINIISPESINNKLFFPIFKDIILDLGIFYILFAAIVIIGTSNAVNLTDGLDGLAAIPIAIVAGSFALISYLVGNILYSNYLHLPYIQGAGEISIITSAIVGASLGFLWYNAPPAKIFMGDTGSLSIGAVIGTISVITRNELNLIIIGGIFVIEALSVIIQVYSFKLTGKRVFKMAPLHHHFEQKGWSETSIVIRFWVISLILAIIGLATLKIR